MTSSDHDLDPTDGLVAARDRPIRWKDKIIALTVIYSTIIAITLALVTIAKTIIWNLTE